MVGETDDAGSSRVIPSRDDGNVAVIAVHGVADQKPHETALQAADLLMHLEELEGRSGGGHYPGFEEESMRIATTSIKLGSKQDADTDPATPPWLREIITQLKKFRLESSKENYDTLRLEGTRLEGSGTQQVHVYEMFWADLSRLGKGVFSILIALYRLLFELAWVGNRALQHDRPVGTEKAPSRYMKFLGGLHYYYTVSISCVIPLLNVFLIGLLFIIGSAGLAWAEGDNPGQPYRLLVAGITSLLAVGIYAWWLRCWVMVKSLENEGEKVAVRRWQLGGWSVKLVVALGLAVTISVLVYYGLTMDLFGLPFARPAIFTEQLLSGLLWLSIFGLLMMTVVELIKQRQGAGRTYRVSGIIFVFLSVMLWIGVRVETPLPRMVSGGAYALVMGVAILGVVWLVVLTMAATFVALARIRVSYLRRWMKKLQKNPAADGKGETVQTLRMRAQTMDTAILSVTLPTMLTMLLNVGLWWAAILPLKSFDSFDELVREAIERREREESRTELIDAVIAIERQQQKDWTEEREADLREQFLAAEDDRDGVAAAKKTATAGLGTTAEQTELKDALKDFQQRAFPSHLVSPTDWALNLEKEVIPISQTTGFLAALERNGVDFNHHEFLLVTNPVDIPTSGREQTIIATDRGNIRLRVFGSRGETLEKKGLDLWPKSQETTELKEILKGHWQDGALTPELRSEVAPIVARIFGRADFRFSDLVDEALNNTVFPYVNISFVLVLLMLVYSCWIFLPAILSEGTPLTRAKRRRREELDPLKEAANHARLSQDLGKKLHAAFRSLSFAQTVLVGCIVFLLICAATRQVTAARLAVDELTNPAEKPSVSWADRLILGIERNAVLPRRIQWVAADGETILERSPWFQRQLHKLPLQDLSNTITVGNGDLAYQRAEDASRVIDGLAKAAYVAIAVLLLLANTPIGGFMRPIFDSFRAGLDVALDVVNYMRLRPDHHIKVGTPVARRPPRRSRRADFPHRAPRRIAQVHASF